MLTALVTSPLAFRLASGFALIIPALIFIAVMRKYLLNMWGSTIRQRNGRLMADIEIRNLVKTYPGQHERATDEVSFEVRAGDTVYLRFPSEALRFYDSETNVGLDTSA